MNNLYLILENFPIFIQLVIWLLCFYWLDLELYPYIFIDYAFLKMAFGMMMVSCQIYLYQYIYMIIRVDSIFEAGKDTELQNINEKHDYTTCKKCNILRPKRAHHCRYCNKCILEMDHHCFSLNKCIGKNNYQFFLRYLIFAQLNSLFIFCVSLYVCYTFYSDLSLFTLIKYGILIFASLMGSFGLFFYLLFHLYLNISNLTTIEVIYPNLRINNIRRTDN